MTSRAPRPAHLKALLCTLLLVCSITVPLNAAHQVATCENNPASGMVYGGAAADSTGDGQIGESGDPTEIDQILEILITLSSVIQRLGL